MSASLVGSEMCIRDRPRLRGRCRRPARRWRLREAATVARTSTSVWTRSCCLLYTSDAADDM
eukprot:13651638-Alexandrium_andersonii.AAC.1